MGHDALGPQSPRYALTLRVVIRWPMAFIDIRRTKKATGRIADRFMFWCGQRLEAVVTALLVLHAEGFDHHVQESA